MYSSENEPMYRVVGFEVVPHRLVSLAAHVTCIHANIGLLAQTRLTGTYLGQGCPTFLTGGPNVQISN